VNNSIDLPKFIEIFLKMDSSFTKQEMETLYKQIDLNGDNLLTAEEIYSVIFTADL
jgi:hypothetical protein